MKSLMSSMEAMKCMSELSALGDDSSSSGSSSNADDTAYFQDDVCPGLAKMSPCLLDVLVPAIENAMTKTNGCCDALGAQIEAVFGSPSLHVIVSEMVGVFGNAFCTERPGDGSIETCGDSLVKNWLPHWDESDTQKAAWAVLDGFQIPNNQVCKAVNSKPFVTTMGKTQQFGAPDITPYGACYAPMDAMLQYVRGLPLWKLAGPETAAVVNDIFGNDRCLAGQDFISWATDADGLIIKSASFVEDAMLAFATLGGGHYLPPVDTSNSGDNDDCSDSGDGDEGSSSGNAEDQEEPSTIYDGNSDAPAKKVHRRLQDSGNIVQAARSFFDGMRPFAGDLCIHLPNGVACGFPRDALELPYAMDNSTATDN